MAEEKWYNKKITLDGVKKGLGKIGISFGNKQAITGKAIFVGDKKLSNIFKEQDITEYNVVHAQDEINNIKEESKQGKVYFEDGYFKVEKQANPDLMTRGSKPTHEDLLLSESDRTFNGRKISGKNWMMLKEIEKKMSYIRNVMDVENSRGFKYDDDDE